MKWYGQIAFNNQTQVEPGIWESGDPIVRNYYGDVIRDSKRDQLQRINNDIVLVNILSVIADPYLINSFHDILYVTYGGSKWRISSVENNYPRLILHFGNLYKEDEVTTV